MSPEPQREFPSQYYRTTIPLIVLVLVILPGSYWSTAEQIGRIWWGSETYAHGLVVIPAFAWLLWYNRDSVGKLRPEPTLWAMVPVVLAGFAWILGKIVSVNALAHASLVAMVVASLIGVLGWRLATALTFPLAFLFFAVPIGDFMLPTLMRWTAEFTVLALRASGVPVYQEGLFFIVPNARWSVVEACSGIRYLIASVMVGSLYAYLNYRSAGRRALFMGVAVLVPIIANWLRAYMIVMLGYHTDNRVAVGVDHLLYGWVFFGIVIFLMFWIGSFWREDTGAPRMAIPRTDAGTQGSRAATVVALLGVAMIFPLALAYVERPVEPFTVRLQTPAPKGDWELEADDPFGFRPDYSGHRGEVLQVYRRGDGDQVGLYVAYYADQREGAELVAWANRIAGEGRKAAWRTHADGWDRLDFARVRRAVIANDQGRMAVWYWYWSDGRIVTSDVRAKVMLALDRLTGRRDDAALIAVFAPIDEQPDELRPLVQSFLTEHLDALEAELRLVEARR